MKKTLAAALLALSTLATGCSSGITEISSDAPTGDPAGATSASTSHAPAPPTTGPEMTADTGTLEDGLKEEPQVVLRVEGDSGVAFSGLCSVGGEQAVLGGGSVPKRYGFDPGGERLSCRIQKQDSGDGDLKVTLLAGNSTRSVQQVDTPDGAIKVSYDD